MDGRIARRATGNSPQGDTKDPEYGPNSSTLPEIGTIAGLFTRKLIVGVTFLDFFALFVGQFLIDLIDVLGDRDHLLRDQV